MSTWRSACVDFPTTAQEGGVEESTAVLPSGGIRGWGLQLQKHWPPWDRILERKELHAVGAQEFVGGGRAPPDLWLKAGLHIHRVRSSKE